MCVYMRMYRCTYIYTFVVMLYFVCTVHFYVYGCSSGGTTSARLQLMGILIKLD